MSLKPNTKQFKHETKHRGSTSEVLPDVNLTKLARVSGVNRSQLSRIVNGYLNPGMSVLERLRDAMGMESVEDVQVWLKKLRAVKAAKQG
jgi:transcriptional regulator with XRE-family HTH domain